MAAAWTAEFGPDLPEVVAFERGIRLLELVSGDSFAGTKQDRMKLQQLRNNSYLEHGFQRINEAQAMTAIERARALCATFLEREMDLALLVMNF